LTINPYLADNCIEPSSAYIRYCLKTPLLQKRYNETFLKLLHYILAYEETKTFKYLYSTSMCVSTWPICTSQFENLQLSI